MRTDNRKLRVLIVDDEPYIRQGLRVLIDWDAEGFCISDEAENGIKAIELMKKNTYDLILSDIKMSEMDGVELIAYVDEYRLSNANFIFLSGYYEFSYAKTAIRHGCCDYILKPIQKEELLSAIRKIRQRHELETDMKRSTETYETAYLENCLEHVIRGIAGDVQMKYVREKLRLSGDIIYIYCKAVHNDEMSGQSGSSDMEAQQKRIFEEAGMLLEDCRIHLIKDKRSAAAECGFGILYSQALSDGRFSSEKAWLEWFLNKLTELTGRKITAYMGSKVSDMSSIPESYKEAMMMYSLQAYKKGESSSLKCRQDLESGEKDTYKKEIDELIHSIEMFDGFKVKQNARKLYMTMTDKITNEEMVNRYIQYLLFRLLGLAYQQDAEVDQEEIMRYIHHSVFSSGVEQLNIIKFQRFIEEYTNYLAQLTKVSACRMISMVEKDIEQNYAENISLKLLGEKYYINSVYLGQLFKRHVGCNFKDYLNDVRIKKAAEMIRYTDKKIYRIAEEVGYRKREYFNSKFYEAYQETPSEFRRRYRDI